MKKFIYGLIISFFLASCSSSEKKHEELKTIAIETRVSLDSTPKTEISKSTIIDIQPFEGIPENLVNHVYTELCKIHPRVTLLKPIALLKRAYYAPRNRYRADTLIYLLRSTTKDGHVTMGLTNKDISSDKGKIIDYGIMGLGYQPGKACVVSPFRLSKKNLNEQFFKVAIHELGHTQGLPHCPNKTCLMTDAEGKNNTDDEKGFCEKCKAFLIAKGWTLK